MGITMKDLPLADGAGVLLGTYGAEQFARDAAECFVHLAGALAECSHHLHLAMPVLAQAVRSALASGSVSTAVDLCSFVGDAMTHPRAASELTSAVAIS